MAATKSGGGDVGGSITRRLASSLRMQVFFSEEGSSRPPRSKRSAATTTDLKSKLDKVGGGKASIRVRWRSVIGSALLSWFVRPSACSCVCPSHLHSARHWLVPASYLHLSADSFNRASTEALIGNQGAAGLFPPTASRSLPHLSKMYLPAAGTGPALRNAAPKSRSIGERYMEHRLKCQCLAPNWLAPWGCWG